MPQFILRKSRVSCTPLCTPRNLVSAHAQTNVPLLWYRYNHKTWQLAKARNYVESHALNVFASQIVKVMNNARVSNENSINAPSANSWRQVKGFGKRHILVLLGLLGFANVYALRVNLSVALVAMVNSTYSNGNEETKSHECGSADSSSSDVVYAIIMFFLLC